MQLSYIDFNVLRKITWQTADLQRRHHVRYHAVILLDTNTVFFAHKVQGDVDVDFLVHLYPQKISMHDVIISRMPLQCFNNRIFTLAIDDKSDDMCKKSLILTGFVQGIL